MFVRKLSCFSDTFLQFDVVTRYLIRVILSSVDREQGTTNRHNLANKCHIFPYNIGISYI